MDDFMQCQHQQEIKQKLNLLEVHRVTFNKYNLANKYIFMKSALSRIFYKN